MTNQKKPRVQVQKNTRTEIHHDSRTSRLRTRGDAKRAAIESEVSLDPAYSPETRWLGDDRAGANDHEEGT